jgi:hypothetical protein
LRASDQESEIARNSDPPLECPIALISIVNVEIRGSFFASNGDPA